MSDIFFQDYRGYHCPSSSSGHNLPRFIERLVRNPHAACLKGFARIVTKYPGLLLERILGNPLSSEYPLNALTYIMTSFYSEKMMEMLCQKFGPATLKTLLEPPNQEGPLLYCLDIIDSAFPESYQLAENVLNALRVAVKHGYAPSLYNHHPVWLIIKPKPKRVILGPDYIPPPDSYCDFGWGIKTGKMRGVLNPN